MNHIIRKQTILLTLSKRMNGFKVQHQVSRFYYDQLLGVLEKTFDALSNQDEMISIDRIEIDLGSITMQQLMQPGLSETFQKKLVKHLREVLQTGSKESIVTRQSISHTFFQQWVFYMKEGRLPWTVLEANAGWYDKVWEILATDYQSVSQLRMLIKKDRIALERIVSQHPRSSLLKIVTVLTAKNQEQLPLLVDDIILAKKIIEAKIEKGQPLSAAYSEKRIWINILLLAAQNENNLSTPVISEKIILSELGHAGMRLIAEMPAAKVTLSFIQPIIQTIATTITAKEDIPVIKKPRSKTDVEQPDVLKKKNISKQEDIGKVPLAPQHTSNEKIKANNVQSLVTDVGEPPAKRIEIDEEGIYVFNAGLVLIHPFLPQFFRNINLTVDNKFIDEFNHQKALHLLHFLATGQTNPDEHELFIAKILTDYPANRVVEKEMVLSENELAEANELLTAVVEHWKFLGNTSPDGLRASFLQRIGKIYSQSEQMRLLVESASYDMLLDRLPWNISLIKLPWMEKMLHVEWR